MMKAMRGPPLPLPPGPPPGLVKVNRLLLGGADAAHHLFRLQGLVVEDEGDASADHLQPPSAVEDGAALPRHGH